MKANPGDFSFEQHPREAWFEKSALGGFFQAIIPFKHGNYRESWAGCGIDQLSADPAQKSGKGAQNGSLGMQPAGKDPPWAVGRKELEERKN